MDQGRAVVPQMGDQLPGHPFLLASRERKDSPPIANLDIGLRGRAALAFQSRLMVSAERSQIGVTRENNLFRFRQWPAWTGLDDTPDPRTVDGFIKGRE